MSQNDIDQERQPTTPRSGVQLDRLVMQDVGELRKAAKSVVIAVEEDIA